MHPGFFGTRAGVSWQRQLRHRLWRSGTGGCGYVLHRGIRWRSVGVWSAGLSVVLHPCDPLVILIRCLSDRQLCCVESGWQQGMGAVRVCVGRHCLYSSRILSINRRPAFPARRGRMLRVCSSLCVMGPSDSPGVRARSGLWQQGPLCVTDMQRVRLSVPVSEVGATAFAGAQIACCCIV